MSHCNMESWSHLRDTLLRHWLLHFCFSESKLWRIFHSRSRGNVSRTSRLHFCQSRSDLFLDFFFRSLVNLFYRFQYIILCSLPAKMCQSHLSLLIWWTDFDVTLSLIGSKEMIRITSFAGHEFFIFKNTTVYALMYEEQVSFNVNDIK